MSDDGAAAIESLQTTHAELITKFKSYVEQEKQLTSARGALEKEAKSFSKIHREVVKMAKTMTPEEQDKLSDMARTVKPIRGRMPVRGGFPLSPIIGSVNVRLSPSERIAFKQAYEQWKFKAAMFLIAALLVTLVVPVLDILSTTLLFAFYIIITLRESILTRNGSRIRFWWRAHHYLSSFAAFILVTWCSVDCAVWRDIRCPVLSFMIYVFIVQILQTRYQLSRLYTLTALDRAHVMDTTNAETIQYRRGVSMPILLPFLWIAHGWQFLIGYRCAIAWGSRMLLAFNDPYVSAPQWQGVIIAGSFMLLAIGNIYTTLHTVVRRVKSVVRQRRERKAE
ncbi:TMPIT-like [Carpediemonas membranifera]|uniref:TMPIT-like n=1 Tax=Carpediemonas membranifera TaxID=201153 RepID=A0A8J6BA30_9EUKA|nr:TMPIT-like [Carpediemonas membranifera]|eukprot:KAG9393102.1 TMPIT-like [Carpediemonas membranifera]